MSANWYTFHSHPHKEDLLNQQIQTRGYETYYPTIRVQPVNPRARKIQAYFPVYLFLRVDLEAIGVSVFQWIPYGTGLVCFGGEPAVVPDPFIQTLRKHVAEINLSGGKLFESFHPGDEITVNSGPFEGYVGIFNVRLPGSERVQILLKMLSRGREIPVELYAGQISRKKRPAR